MGWTKVCEANSLSNGDLIGFDHNNKRILIAKALGKIYATDGICTHEYADLSTGFLNEEESTVTCPLHLSVFKLDDGIPQNPPAETPLKTYNTKIEGNGIYVLLE
ncbi:MAG: non-heme iron oxygenase ferredoxin subunit [Candidatus Nitrosopolaris sp.]